MPRCTFVKRGLEKSGFPDLTAGMWYAKNKGLQNAIKAELNQLRNASKEAWDEHADRLDQTAAKDFDGCSVLAHPSRGLVQGQGISRSERGHLEDGPLRQSRADHA